MIRTAGTVISPANRAQKRSISACTVIQIAPRMTANVAIKNRTAMVVREGLPCPSVP